MAILDPGHRSLSDAALLDAVTRLAAEGRQATAELVALLAVLDARRLYLGEGYHSLFDFCVRHLRLSEAEAYHRIEAARAARHFPAILERLRTGALTLTNVALLRPHLTEANHAEVLAWAEGRSKREVEVFVRSLAPRPDVRTSIRRLEPARPSFLRLVAVETTHAHGQSEGADPAAPHPTPPAASGPSSEFDTVAGPLTSAEPVRSPLEPPAPAAAAACAPPPARPAAVRPLAPARYSLQVTISEETHGKLRRAQALLGHVVPSADLALVLDRALTLLVEALERKKFAARKTPRPREKRPTRSRPAAPERGTGRVRDGAARREPMSRRATGPGEPGRAAMPPESTALARPAKPPGAAREAAAGSTSPPGSPNGPPAQPTGDPALYGAGVSRPRAGDVCCSAAPAPTARVATAAGRRSRAIPAAVRREVWTRDEGRCTFIGSAGRCRQTAGLEYHHRVPVADGGPHTATNVTLRCAGHHAWESARWFGDDVARPRAQAASPENSVRTELP